MLEKMKRLRLIGMFVVIFAGTFFFPLMLFSQVKDEDSWLTIQDDDGTCESPWGKLQSRSGVICKIIKLDIDPGEIKKAKVKYLVAFRPYDPVEKRHYKKLPKDVKYADLVILVNDLVAVQKPARELTTKGWHEVPISPELLRKGDNTIKFTWAKTPKGENRHRISCLYLAIDTDTNHHRSCSSVNGKTFSFDVLCPGPNIKPDKRWQGEYMIRLEILLKSAADLSN